MCYTDEDDELWQEDPYEFIRVKYGEKDNITSTVSKSMRFCELHGCSLLTLNFVKEIFKCSIFLNQVPH